jgi:hypothetical protein
VHTPSKLEAPLDSVVSQRVRDFAEFEGQIHSDRAAVAIKGEGSLPVDVFAG